MWGRGGSPTGLNPSPVDSDTVSRKMVSELSEILGHPAALSASVTRSDEL